MENLNQTNAVSNILSLRVSSSRLRRYMSHQNNGSIKRIFIIVRKNGFKSCEKHFVAIFLAFYKLLCDQTESKKDMFVLSGRFLLQGRWEEWN